MLSETLPILRRMQSDSIINVQYVGFHLSYSLFLSEFEKIMKCYFFLIRLFGA